jgi:DNA-binding IclR family transcriptional regulator
VSESDPVSLRIRESLERLRDLTGETAIDAVLATDRSLYLDVVESRELVRFAAQPGETKPLHLSASGRAQLAVLEEGARRAVVAALPAGGAGRARLNRKALLETVDAERRRGWSTNLGEFRPDVISVAAGFDLHGTVHSLVIAAPRHRVEAKADQIGRLLRDEARALVARLP